MTTLPPEDPAGHEPAGHTAGDPAPTTPPTAPPAPPAAPQVPPAPPAAPQTPPAAPQFQAPPAPPVPPQQPQQPQPTYQAPQQHQAPPAPQYGAPGQTPPPGGYQQPPAGYGQPAADPTSNIVLNYWLSVFFSWIPALIFFLIDKDKGDQRVYTYQRDNLNFALLRVGVGIATWILAMIPYIGWLFALLLWAASAVLFVFHIIAAVKASEGFRRGEQPGFIFNLPLIK